MIRTALLFAAASLLAAPALAADTPEPAPPRPAAAPADPLKGAREAVAAQRWGTALDELRRINATGNADWNNLMGFALRKQAGPDLDGAQRHYDEALRLNPGHRGALEYAGELSLMKGNLPDAEAKLASLARLCSSPCEELDDLQKAVARYKANGNRHQP